MALVENIQRQDLDPIEISLSYQRLIDEINLTQEQLSDRVGKKPFYHRKLFTIAEAGSDHPDRNAGRISLIWVTAVL